VDGLYPIFRQSQRDSVDDFSDNWVSDDFTEMAFTVPKYNVAGRIVGNVARIYNVHL
jgi:hypothetical protein